MEINDVNRTEPIIIKNETYTLSRPNFETEEKFAVLCRDHAIALSRRYMDDPPIFNSLIKSITDSFAAREYDWSGSVVQRARVSENGFKDLMFLILSQKGVKQPRAVTGEVFDKLWTGNEAAFIEAWNRLNKPSPPTPPQE